MQPGVTPGASIELHAARADSGHGPGVNAPTLLTTWRDTSGNGLSGTLTTFSGSCEEAATNYITNPRLIDDNSDGTPNLWTLGSTVAGTPTFTVIDRYCGRYAIRCQYTGVAGDAAGNKAIYIQFATAAGTFAEGDPLTAQATVSGSATGCVAQLYAYTRTAAAALVDSEEGVITLGETPTRFSASLPACGASVSYAQIRLYFASNIGEGDTLDVTWELPMIEKAASAGTYFDGVMHACSWSGTADASTSSHGDNWSDSGWMGAGTAADPYRLVFADGDSVTLPDMGISEDKVFTMEAWFYSPQIKPFAEAPALPYFWIFGERGPVGTSYPEDGLCIYMPAAKGVPRFFFRDRDGGNALIYGPGGTDEDICDGLLHHMLAVSDGTHCTLYVDGVAGTPVDVPAGTVAMDTTTLGDQGGIHHLSHGAIVLARAYPTALTPAQIAANYAAGPTWAEEADTVDAAVRTLTIAGHNLSALVDWDALDRSSSEHLYASFSIDLPLSSQWEALPVGIVAGAAIEYDRNGVTLWEGTVARITRSGPADPVATIEGRGYWAELSDRDDFVKGFVETRYEKFAEMNPRTSYLGVITNSGAIQADTEDQLLLVIPNGTVAKTNQGGYYVLYILDGLGLASANIDYVEMSVGYGGTADAMACVRLIENPTDIGNALLLNAGTSGTDPDEKIASDFSAYGGLQAIAVEFLIGANITLTADAFIQIRDMKLYIDRTTAPTIDAAIYEAANGLGIATSSSLTTVGSAVNQLMWDEPSTPESHITETLGRHSAPVICGIGKDRCMTIAPRAGGPAAPYRHFVVSQALQPGMVWGVQLDDEASKDYVRCIYGLIPENDCATPHPTSATWPTTWYRSSESNCVVAATEDRFQIISNSTEYNPYAEYLGADSLGIPVTEGQLYIARCRSYIGAYVDGTARISVLWYTDSTYLTDYDVVKDYTAAGATEKWWTLYCVPPEGANRARIRIRWTGATSGAGRSLYVRDVTFRPADTEGTLKSYYYPSTPTATNHKVGLVALDRATETEAEGVAAQAYDLWHEPYSGPVSGLVGTIFTANGQAVPVEEIQPWDWIENLDAPDAARGPHMVTAVHEAGGEVDIQCGGDVAFHYEREIVNKRGRYIGAHRVWVKPRYKRVKGKRKLVKRGYWKTIEARYR